MSQQVRDWPRANTPYGFLVGLLSGLSADWSGCGPTYRRWAFREPPNRAWWSFVGQMTGFLMLIALMVAASMLAIAGYETLGTIVALMISVLIVLANVIAAKLP